MAVNTGYMDDGKYTAVSSLSVVASRATVLTQDLTVNSVASIGGAFTGQGGATINSGTTLSALGITGIFTSSLTTAQSAATAKIVNGQVIFSVLSLTTNGAALYYRSGNSTYVWPSSGVIG